MKHSLRITLLLVFIFFIAQVIGLAITSRYVHVEERFDSLHNTFVKEIVLEDLPYKLERPKIDESFSYIWITAAIFVGTALLLLLIKLRKIGWWKAWFFLAVFLTMTIAFSAFMPQWVASALAFVLAVMKVYKPVTIVQNATEIFIYGGLAAIFVPIINIFAASMLLLLISVYDIIAVRHTKHMISLAEFQAKTNVFAGLFIPYSRGGKPAAREEGIMQGKKGRIAVLGGGDIGFPLLFAGVVLKGLMLESPAAVGFLKSMIIPIFATAALFYLLLKGEKHKFYPAMPYISAGCFIGYAVVLLI